MQQSNRRADRARAYTTPPSIDNKIHSIAGQVNKNRRMLRSFKNWFTLALLRLIVTVCVQQVLRQRWGYMKISGKVLFSVSVIILAYTVIVFIVLKVFVAPQFVRLEREAAHNDLSRAGNVLEREILSVSSYGADYARWDDTYRYIERPSQAYIDCNYVYASMKMQNINFVSIVDVHGKILFSRFFSSDGRESIMSDCTIPSASLGRFVALGAAHRDGVYQGFVGTSLGLMIVASYPIVDSQMEKSSNGRLIAGRVFGKIEHEKIRAILKTDITFDPVSSAAVQAPAGSTGGITEIAEKHMLVLSRGIPDVFGIPCMSMTLRHPRMISEKGSAVLGISMLILVGCGSIVLVVLLLYLNRGVVFPLTELDRRSKDIATAEDFVSRLPQDRSDEIGDLAHSFNLLLDRLSSVNVMLEQRVAERTAELQKLNLDLVLLGKVFENSLEGNIITDKQGVILKVNPAFTRITGFSPEEVVGLNSMVMRSDRHDDAFYLKMTDEVAKNGKWSGELWSRNRNGRAFPLWLSISSITDDEGCVSNFIWVFHDISDAKQQESYIKYQAFHDTLTGLPNRVLFLERMNRSIAHSFESGEHLALLFLDLDHFKNVNDSMGHEYGDVLLQHVAERLEKLTRDSDTVSRLGGDEFIIMIENADGRDQPALLAERIIDSFRNPFLVKDQILHIGASIGIAMFPEDGDESSILMRNADTAMYRAKEDGRLRYCHFTNSLNERLTSHIRMESDLRMAIESNEFEVYYQPKVSFSTGDVEGFEALVRWNNGGKMICPVEFIPLAEETGLILPLDRIVMRRAFMDICALNRSRKKPYHVAVNASAKALQERTFPDEVKNLMTALGVRPEWLEIEITETAVMKDIDACIDVIRCLSDMGISIALDDFGTGYSSLSQLSRIPVNTLKIDRSFVMTIDSGKNGVSIVENIYDLAKTLSLKVVAEGVETLAQREYLEKIGCDLMQGYFVSKPLPLRMLEKFLSEAGSFTVYR
jgi:diguanylate cyclase (GGDEF)-like protein/PAS domain S-box-containing protein